MAYEHSNQSSREDSIDYENLLKWATKNQIKAHENMILADIDNEDMLKWPTKTQIKAHEKMILITKIW